MEASENGSANSDAHRSRLSRWWTGLVAAERATGLERSNQMFSSNQRLVRGMQDLMFRKAGLQTSGKAPDEEDMAVRVGDETHNHYSGGSRASGVSPGWIVAALLGGGLLAPHVAELLRPDPAAPAAATGTDTDTQYELRISSE